MKVLTDGQPDGGQTNDGQKVITIAHPEHSSGELKKQLKFIKACDAVGISAFKYPLQYNINQVILYWPSFKSEVSFGQVQPKKKDL